MSLATLSIDLVAKVAAFEKDLQRVVAATQAQADKMAASLGTVKTALGSLAGVFSVGIAVEFVRGTINSVDALNDLKDATGASIENLSALEDVAVRSGNSVDAMADSLVKFNKVLNEATPGSDMDKTLKSIGLNAAELRKIDPAEALRLTAVALSGYADDGNKARLIQDLFGKSIREAGPWLKDLAEAGTLNAKVTTEQAQNAEDFNKALAELSKNSRDASRSLISDYLPAVNAILEAYNKGGISAATDELGNRLFDWQGSQQRKVIKNIQSDLQDLREQEAAITIDVFGQKGKIQQEIAAKTAMLEAAQAAYFKLTNVQGGRGVVNPPLVDGRVSAPEPFKNPPKAAAKASLTEAQASLTEAQTALAAYVKTLESAVDKTQEFSEVERANQFLLSLGKDGEIAQVRELVLGLATRIDQEKELIELLKLKRAAATAAGDEVNATNKWLADLESQTPTAKLEAQRKKMAELADFFQQGVFGDPQSEEAAKKYGELVRVQLGIAGEAVQELKGDFDSLGATFSSALEDAIVNGEDLRAVVQGLAQDIERIVVRKTLTEPIGNAVTESLKGFNLGSLFSFLGFADGGIMTSRGPVPLRAYATGGIASTPQLAMYGEGSMAEAFVPLPDGRSIPVTMKGGAAGAPPVVVNIYNTVGDVASVGTVVRGMQTVRAQIVGELSRSQRFGGALA